VPAKLAQASELTLAEVYGIARESGWAPVSRKVKEAKESESLKNAVEPYDQRDADYEAD